MKTRRVPCSGSANLEDAEKGTRRKRGRESFVEEEEEKKKKREEEEKGTFYFFLDWRISMRESLAFPLLIESGRRNKHNHAKRFVGMGTPPYPLMRDILRATKPPRGGHPQATPPR